MIVIIVIIMVIIIGQNGVLSVKMEQMRQKAGGILWSS